MDTVLQSRSRTVTIAIDKPFCIIGERINPTGRKAFALELRNGNLDQVLEDADAQIAMGCDMLDVNAGIPLVDEAELLAQMIHLIQEHNDFPLCIDSSVIERVKNAADPREEAFELAVEQARHALAQPGVRGLHLISFRKDDAVGRLCERLGIPPTKERDASGHGSAVTV